MIVSATSNFMGNKLSCPFKVGAQDYYCSYILRGLEQKMIQQNIALMNLWRDINLLNKGKTTSAVQHLGKAFTPTTPTKEDQTTNE